MTDKFHKVHALVCIGCFLLPLHLNFMLAVWLRLLLLKSIMRF